ncbi:dTDP-4-dehydrorhamnose reductase [Antarcticibacterium sp. 1MA-6-2]|nr:dTDP-4-dehydrorhamnose reductase [Antarcticibacterium sp. 1MA-6-2]UJH93007.1 dTDP-4-dehydrorhamnose reductase [Antarcticibacterium sp. 1MA-6-2]
MDWLFMDSSEVDITLQYNLQQVFNSKSIDVCINCAAYTNVEKAESDTETAYLINSEAVKNIAEICRRNEAVLYHFSTDYVFKGTAQMPYTEEDKTQPLNVYGDSKLKGEEHIKKILDSFFIFRTSWLYSQYGHNFYNTILKKVKEGAQLNITTSQTSSPTNANHLAQFVVNLIIENNSRYGLYHYSNAGETTWYGFAREILRASGNLDEVSLIEDNSYKTIATRPAYSVLDKTKLKNTFNYPVASWQMALEELYQSEVNKN